MHSSSTNNIILKRISKFSYIEIENLFKKSYYIYKSLELDVKIAKKQSNISRILLIIPKRVGNAPKRNLIRRRIKSIFYENRFYLLDYDFIVFCKKDILNLKFQDLLNIFLEIKHKLSL